MAMSLLMLPLGSLALCFLFLCHSGADVASCICFSQDREWGAIGYCSSCCLPACVTETHGLCKPATGVAGGYCRGIWVFVSNSAVLGA